MNDATLSKLLSSLVKIKNMKKTLLTILLLSGIALGLSPILFAKSFAISELKNRNSETEYREVKGFTKIETSGAFEIRIIKSDSYSVKVEADEKILKSIITEVVGDKLVIRLDKSGKNDCDSKMNARLITIQMPTLTALTCSGASEVHSNDVFEVEKFELKTSGASEVELGINAKLLISKFSGASDIDLKGKVDTHALEMTGASDLDAENLQTSKYAISSKGASDCRIYVTDELSISGSGASSIKYKGSPSKITKDTKGATEVSKL